MVRAVFIGKDRYHLVVFMTLGNSLKTWCDAGILERELSFYGKFEFPVLIVTYGFRSDLDIIVPPNVDIYPLRADHWLPKATFPLVFWSILLPLYVRIPSGRYYKSNQLWGCWVPFFFAKLNRGIFIARGGYDFFDFMKKGGVSWLFLFGIKLLLFLPLRLADKILLPNQRSVDSITNEFGIHDDRVLMLPNWIPDYFFADASRCSAPKDFGLIYVARDVLQKRVGLFISVCDQVNISSLLVSDVAPERKAELASGNVKILAPMPHQDLALLYARCSCYVSTARYEGHPKAVLEAMAAGLPVICLDGPGITDIVEHGFNGYVCEDLAELVTRVNSLLSDGELLNQLSINASSSVNSLKWSKIFSLERSIYG